MGPVETTELVEQEIVLTPAEMDRLVEQHIAAESIGDTDGAVAMYTDDDPRRRRRAARAPARARRRQGFLRDAHRQHHNRADGRQPRLVRPGFLRTRAPIHRNRARRVSRHSRKRQADLVPHAPRLGITSPARTSGSTATPSWRSSPPEPQGSHLGP